MKNIVGIRFKKPGKIYFFDPGELNPKLGDSVLVETSMGKELGIISVTNRKVDESKLKEPLKKIIKIADSKDKRT